MPPPPSPSVSLVTVGPCFYRYPADAHIRVPGVMSGEVADDLVARDVAMIAARKGGKGTYRDAPDCAHGGQGKDKGAQ